MCSTQQPRFRPRTLAEEWVSSPLGVPDPVRSSCWWLVCGFKVSEAEPAALGIPWSVEGYPGLGAGGWHPLEGSRGEGPAEAVLLGV